jgi:hypothetical protein
MDRGLVAMRIRLSVSLAFLSNLVLAYVEVSDPSPRSSAVVPF